MQPLQICIGPTIRIGRESWCLPYAGFFFVESETIVLSQPFPKESFCNRSHGLLTFVIGSNKMFLNMKHEATQLVNSVNTRPKRIDSKF